MKYRAIKYLCLWNLLVCHEASLSLLRQSVSSRRRTYSHGSVVFPLFIITAYSCWVSFNCLWSWAEGQCWQFGSANFCSHTAEEWTDSRWGVAFHPALCASEWTHLTLSPWDFVISSVSTNVWRLEALPRLNCRPHASRAYLLTPRYGKQSTIYLMKCVLKLNYKNSGAF